MQRWSVPVLLLIFIVTRATMIHFANEPDSYPFANAPFTADVDVVYHERATSLTDGLEPYTEFDLEYAPGAIPFLVIPKHSWPFGGAYRNGFIKLMVLVDAAGLLGLIALSRRWGSMAGPWAWVLALPLVGPMAYLRLDLVPAVAGIWALRAAAAGRWSSTGGWLGFGAITKVYPIFLLPVATLAAPSRNRLRVVAWFVGVMAAVSATVFIMVGGNPAAALGDIAPDVSSRGLHLESTGGSLLLIAERLGVATPIVSTHNTLYFQGGAETLISPLVFLITGAAVAMTALAGLGAERREEGGSAQLLASTSFALLALMLGVAALFSPQYVIWLVASGAAVLCLREPHTGRWAPWMLFPMALMTQFVYPWQYHRILSRDTLGLTVLAGRNLLVLTTGIVALIAIIRRQGPDGPVPSVWSEVRRVTADLRQQWSEKKNGAEPS